jgi:hypothetical protein
LEDFDLVAAVGLAETATIRKVEEKERKVSGGGVSTTEGVLLLLSYSSELLCIVCRCQRSQ